MSLLCIINSPQSFVAIIIFTSSSISSPWQASSSPLSSSSSLSSSPSPTSSQLPSLGFPLEGYWSPDCCLLATLLNNKHASATSFYGRTTYQSVVLSFCHCFVFFRSNSFILKTSRNFWGVHNTHEELTAWKSPQIAWTWLFCANHIRSKKCTCLRRVVRNRCSFNVKAS